MMLSTRVFPEAFFPTIRFLAPRCSPSRVHSWSVFSSSEYFTDSSCILVPFLVPLSRLWGYEFLSATAVPRKRGQPIWTNGHRSRGPRSKARLSTFGHDRLHWLASPVYNQRRHKAQSLAVELGSSRAFFIVQSPNLLQWQLAGSRFRNGNDHTIFYLLRGRGALVSAAGHGCGLRSRAIPHVEGQ